MSSDARIKFSCPECGSKLEAPVNRAGRRGKCGSCKADVAVPHAGPSQPAARQDFRENARPRSSLLKRILWATGLILSIAGQIHDLMEFKTIKTFVKSVVPAVALPEEILRETIPPGAGDATQYVTVEEFTARQLLEERAKEAAHGRRSADGGTDAWWVSALKVMALFWAGMIVLVANILMGISLVAKPVTGLDAWPWMAASGRWFWSTAVQEWFWKASNPIGAVVGVMGVVLMLSLMHLFDGQNWTSGE